MLKRALPLLALTLSACATAAHADPAATKTGIPLDQPWKQQLYAYAQQNVVHSIWGIAHSERNYQVAMELARQEGLAVDSDVLFAAAFLHDIGAIEPFRIPGVEHATRSVQIMEPLLRSYGKPEAMIAKVREAILAHMYDADVAPQIPEARVFHDADTLDFLGSIGLVRIVGLTDRHGWAPNLPGGIATLTEWMDELPHDLVTAAAKRMAGARIAELRKIIESLDPYTFSGAAL
ncbi:MAG TPA: HD domain-containing protein [Bdellovibrionota bacterium]|jgi:uncharacterized protein|nr:HD domain-containing protein [Bdellovibrionota bacterium]